MADDSPSKILANIYSASAREYASLWGPVIQPMGERLVAAMAISEASTVLDLGAGTGGLFAALRSAAPAALLVGVDRAQGMLQVAREPDRRAYLAVMDLEWKFNSPHCHSQSWCIERR